MSCVPFSGISRPFMSAFPWLLGLDPLGVDPRFTRSGVCSPRPFGNKLVRPDPRPTPSQHRNLSLVFSSPADSPLLFPSAGNPHARFCTVTPRNPHLPSNSYVVHNFFFPVSPNQGSHFFFTFVPFWCSFFCPLCFFLGYGISLVNFSPSSLPTRG